MKLVRYGDIGAERPGLIDPEGVLRDLSDHVTDINASVLGDAALARLRALDPSALPAVNGSPRLGPVVGDIGKFLCIGLNYSDHAQKPEPPSLNIPFCFSKPIPPSWAPMMMW